MNRFLSVAVLVTAFFVTMTFANAEETAPVCSEELQEIVLTDALSESPELLMATVEEEKISKVFERMKYLNYLVGEPAADKMYIFFSENHPTWVYVFFLKDHCIQDVQFSYKNLVEYLLTGDESLIKPENAK